VANYVEPFAGSLAVLLRRPDEPGNEIVNDLDGYVANAWRAMKLAPEETARYADWPVNEIDLHARHRWLHGRAEFRERMKADPDYFDARVAGYWIWGLSCWIGDNWCQPGENNSRPNISTGAGVTRKIPNLDGGKGMARKIPNLDNVTGVHVKRTNMDRKNGRWVLNPPVDGTGNNHTENLAAWFNGLADRLRHVKVCCGDVWRWIDGGAAGSAV
jgi:hypothetical protein